MNVIALDRGSTTLLFPTEEMRPDNPVGVAPALEALRERYAFAWAPDLSKPYEQVQKGPQTFQGGQLVHDNQLISITSLQFFNDGIIATCSSTEQADIVLQDLIEWGKSSFGYKDPITTPVRLYSSSMIVELDSDLDALLDPMNALTDILKTHLAQAIPAAPVWKATSLRFTGATSLKDVPATAFQFLIERRAQVPFERNRYFSDAPLSTTAHKRLLEAIDKLLPTIKGQAA